jgi:hypothetical protein
MQVHPANPYIIFDVKKSCWLFAIIGPHFGFANPTATEEKINIASKIIFAFFKDLQGANVTKHFPVAFYVPPCDKLACLSRTNTSFYIHLTFVKPKSLPGSRAPLG